MAVDVSGGAGEKPRFEPLMPSEMSDGRPQFRKVQVSLNRCDGDLHARLRALHMKVDIRMNMKARRVELKTREDTPDVSNLQKCADFVHAFVIGFDIADATVLLRLDDLYVDSFEIKDVKTLRGEHLSRAIGRLSRVREAGPNVPSRPLPGPASLSRTQRSIFWDPLLTSRFARDSLCSLILGSPAGEVYSKLRAASASLAERY